MNVVDSTGWIEYFTAGPLVELYRKYIEDPEELLTPSIVLYEVFKKILRDGDEHSAVEAVACIQKTTVVPLDEELAISAAEYSLEHGLAMADAIVYATAQQYGALVITSDTHFRNLSGVEFIEAENQTS